MSDDDRKLKSLVYYQPISTKRQQNCTFKKKVEKYFFKIMIIILTKQQQNLKLKIKSEIE